MTNLSEEIVTIEQITQAQIQYKFFLIPKGTLYIVNKFKYKDGRIALYSELPAKDFLKAKNQKKILCKLIV